MDVADMGSPSSTDTTTSVPAPTPLLRNGSTAPLGRYRSFSLRPGKTSEDDHAASPGTAEGHVTQQFIVLDARLHTLYGGKAAD